jgi:hypothetical protein
MGRSDSPGVQDSLKQSEIVNKVSKVARCFGDGPQSLYIRRVVERGGVTLQAIP